MTTLYLIRHAEPLLRGVFLGSTDPGLSDRGRAEARRKLGSLEAASIYSSPLKRAQETARVIPCATPPVLLDGLREMSFGEWEGLTWAEIETRYPEVAERKVHAWMTVTPPGGETWLDFASRVGHALESVRQGPFPVAVVAHMVVNSAIAQIVNGADPLTFQQEYCEVIHCEL